MIKLYFFTFKKFFKSIGFNRSNYKLNLNLSAPVLHKVSRSRFLHIIPLTLLILISISTSCNTTEPPSNQTFLLKLEDISCTEAWVQLTTNNIQLPATINLLKNDTIAQVINLSYKDTLLYIDSLLPNQTYKILVAMQQYNNVSNELSVRTMDTTSHNFTWQTRTFGGQAGSCALYDVAIIDENNIWAVGEIYMLDSLGRPDPNAYNAAHWNGQSWELKKIRTNACGGVDYPPIKAIFAFSSNDILFAHIDGSISHFNGIGFTNDCSLITQLNGSANKIWGISKDDYYVVSGNGFIAHYQNGNWTRIESGTTTNINDAWGITNKQNNTIVYCAVSSFFTPGDKKILKLINGKVDSVNWSRDLRLYSAWTNNENILYVCGEGVFVNKFSTWSEINLQQVGTNSIRGNNLNDIFIAGDYGFKSHFNGSTWQIYNNNYLKGYSRLSFKGNIVTIAGNYQGKAIVEIGRRN